MFPDADDLKRLFFDAQGMPVYKWSTSTTPLTSPLTSWDCSGVLNSLEFPKLTFNLPDGWEQLITPDKWEEMITPSVQMYVRDNDTREGLTKQPINWDDPNNALGGVTVGIHQELTIKCTPEVKEKIIKLAEEKWEKCMFESGCDPQDVYDCRKCLERRITWQTDGNILSP